MFFPGVFLWDHVQNLKKQQQYFGNIFCATVRHIQIYS
jgi:hypothetical protein